MKESEIYLWTNLDILHKFYGIAVTDKKDWREWAKSRGEGIMITVFSTEDEKK